MGKDILRKDLLTKLTFLPDDEIQLLSFKLTNQLIKFFSHFPKLSDQIGGAYLPLKKETAPVYQELLRKVPLTLAYPVLLEGKMLFGIPNGMPRGGLWLEPPYHLTTPSWLFVPGVAFDFKGARLGRGKGFYDRFLESKNVLTIGLAWSEQILEKIPVEQHDCHMDFIITEEFCWDVDQQTKF